MWTHDGTWHRLDGADLSITVLDSDPPPFDSAIDVEVAIAGQRYSATFMTPEQVRECLTRWMATGESLPGDLFEVPDLVLVGKLSLEAVEPVVRHHLTDGMTLRAPFMPLADD